MKTNKGMVEYAKKALVEKWGYVWGTFGNRLDENLLKAKMAQYPDGVGNMESIIRAKWMGRTVTDCVGMIKSYLWWDGLRVRYNQAQDTSADGMLAKATEKGVIGTIPDLPGVCVWKKGHIGVYIGGGQVIEANGTRTGVIQTPLKGGTPWTHWLKCPWIEYQEETEKAEDEDMKRIKGTIGSKSVVAYLDAEGHAQVPAAALRDLGLVVEWNAKTETVSVTKGGK